MRPRALLLVFSVPAVLCAVWTVAAGKDVNWDLLNYHYYGPFQLAAGRVQQDFFAASAQSYLNPVGYLPFYLMLASGWHSVVASIALALAHSAALGLLYLVAWKLFAHRPPRERTLYACLATALGAATSVYWVTVGSSFLDPLLVVPMLAGLLLLLDAEGHFARRALAAGILFGAAAALKYSNAVFALAALPLALVAPGRSAAARLRPALAYAAGGTFAVALLAGPWLFLMAREFGNPVFPLMNGWFQSPHALAANMISARFTPVDFADALAFPIRVALLDHAVYSELLAPDLRFAALACAALALPIACAWRASSAAALRGADWRALAFFGLGLLLWLFTSANARYGMVLLLLAGVLLARLAERLLEQRVLRVALGLLIALQASMLVIASPSRWLAEPWSRHWLPYAVPERAAREPALYLTVEVQPMAAVARFFHPESSFVNLRGQHSVPTGAPRLAALLERHRGRVRTLGRGLQLVDGRPRPDAVRFYDDTLSRIGYRVDAADCFALAWRSDGDDWLSRAANWLARVQPSEQARFSVVSCALRPVARDPADVAAEARMSSLFDRIERACPELFRGQTAVTERLGSGWSRNYPGLDARLESQGGRVVLSHYRSLAAHDLGRLADWQAGAGACGASSPTANR